MLQFWKGHNDIKLACQFWRMPNASGKWQNWIWSLLYLQETFVDQWGFQNNVDLLFGRQLNIALKTLLWSQSDSFDSTGSETQSLIGSLYNLPPDTAENDHSDHALSQPMTQGNYLATANDEHPEPTDREYMTTPEES